jgi:hypothetical protein
MDSATQSADLAIVDSPDFKKSICLIIKDRAGNEIFRSSPSFSVTEAERIGDAGADEFFHISLAPEQGVKIPGCRWDDDLFCWVSMPSPKSKRSA